MNTAIIIPARLASERLAEKALLLINDKPVIEWVYEACKTVNIPCEVIIATDHDKIYNLAKNFGAKVVMTSKEHRSGTDRCGEVAAQLENIDFIINVQGDEPFTDPKDLEALIRFFETRPEVSIATLYHQFDESHDPDDPSKVKLVKDINDKILYFSRSKIPFYRNETGQGCLKHIGIYGFRRSTLAELVKLEVSPLESAEGLEQLRWLENGYDIYGIEVDRSTIGIDTQADLDEARNYAKGLPR